MTRTITVRPDTGISVGITGLGYTPWEIVGGAASRTAAISDASDATAIDCEHLDNLTVGLASASLSGVVVGARVGLRHRRVRSGGNGWGLVSLEIDGNAVNVADISSLNGVPSSATTNLYDVELPAPYEFSEGRSALTEAIIDGIELTLNGSGSTVDAAWRVYDVWLELDVDEATGAVPVGF